MPPPDPFRGEPRGGPAEPPASGATQGVAERGAHRGRASAVPVLRAFVVTVSGRQQSSRRRRGRSPRLLAVLALLISAVVCAALLGVLQIRAHVDSVAAAQEGAGFTPPPFASATPAPADLIAVVGDEWASPRNTVTNRPWTYLLQRSIGVRVRAFASDGGAYLPGAVGAGGAPFASSVGGIPSTATLVVFFGGARDATDAPAALAAAATQAFADARARAPEARIVVIAPVPTRPGQTARLAQVRSFLRTAAVTARAEYIDPVQEKWLGPATLWDPTTASPSALGNEVLADRIGAALAPFLTKASG